MSYTCAEFPMAEGIEDEHDGTLAYNILPEVPKPSSEGETLEVEISYILENQPEQTKKITFVSGTSYGNIAWLSQPGPVSSTYFYFSLSSFPYKGSKLYIGSTSEDTAISSIQLTKMYINGKEVIPRGFVQ